MSEQTSFFGSAESAAFTSDRTDWETPKDLFARLNQFWHFDLDVASSDENALCENHFTKEQDGLSQSWKGHRVWCNPPYGKDIAKWVKKAYEETRDGTTAVVMLIPARTDTRWYHDYIQNKAAEIKFLKGRLKYTLGGGSAKLRAFSLDAS